MAIAFRARSGTLAAKQTNATLTRPSGLAVGDLMVAIIARKAVKDAITAPTGWTALPVVAQSGTTGITVSVFWKTAAAADTTALNFRFAWATSDYHSSVLLAYSGVDGAFPIAGTGFGQFNASAKAIPAPSRTVVVPGSALLYAGAKKASEAITQPSGYVERSDKFYSGIALETADRLSAPTGASGVVQGTSASSQPNIGILLVIEPPTAKGSGQSEIAVGATAAGAVWVQGAGRGDIAIGGTGSPVADLRGSAVMAGTGTLVPAAGLLGHTTTGRVVMAGISGFTFGGKQAVAVVRVPVDILPPAVVYRFLVADLTGRIREELPLTDVSYGRALSGAGTASAKMPLRHAKATRTNIDPSRTALLIERNQVLVWGGILWAARVVRGGSDIDLALEGWWSYFHRRKLREDRTYIQVDQFEIVRDLISYAQSQYGGDIGVITSAGSITDPVTGKPRDVLQSGVLRDREFAAYEEKGIAEIVEEMAGMDDGFDFLIDTSYDTGGMVGRRLELSYPRRGTRLGIRLDNATVTEADLVIDGTRQVNSWTADGGDPQEGNQRVRATYTDTALLGQYPLLEDAVALSGVDDMATLEQAAKGLTRMFGRPPEIPAVRIRPRPDFTPGSWTVGDVVDLDVRDGFLVITGPYRIVGDEVQVGPEGSEDVALALNPVQV